MLPIRSAMLFLPFALLDPRFAPELPAPAGAYLALGSDPGSCEARQRHVRVGGGRQVVGGLVLAAAGAAGAALIARQAAEDESDPDRLAGGALLFNTFVGGAVMVGAGITHMNRGGAAGCLDLDGLYDGLPERELPDDD